MTTYNETIEISIDSIDVTNKTISIIKAIIVKKDNEEIARSGERCAFVPGDLEKVKAFINQSQSPEIDYLNAIWTQEVIDAYKASNNTNLGD